MWVKRLAIMSGLEIQILSVPALHTTQITLKITTTLQLKVSFPSRRRQHHTSNSSLSYIVSLSCTMSEEVTEIPRSDSGHDAIGDQTEVNLWLSEFLNPVLSIGRQEHGSYCQLQRIVLLWKR